MSSAVTELLLLLLFLLSTRDCYVFCACPKIPANSLQLGQKSFRKHHKLRSPPPDFPPAATVRWSNNFPGAVSFSREKFFPRKEHSPCLQCPNLYQDITTLPVVRRSSQSQTKLKKDNKLEQGCQIFGDCLYIYNIKSRHQNTYVRETTHHYALNRWAKLCSSKQNGMPLNKTTTASLRLTEIGYVSAFSIVRQLSGYLGFR